MDMVIVPASITIENGTAIQRYKWKSENKITIYKRKNKRAFVRITGANFVKRLSEKRKEKRQAKIKFNKKDKEWKLLIKRSKEKGVTLQTHFSSHPYLQLVLNKSLPNEIWKEHKLKGENCYTRKINVEFDLKEWKDFCLKPYDFLIEVEKLSKQLMKEAINRGLMVDFVPKGRAYDLELRGPKGKIFVLAISSHIAKDLSRSKEKRKQKILMDISKLLPYIYNKKIYPIIISEPLEFKGSWSFTTDDYLNFYKDKFNFNFLTTDFKKGWEKDICIQLLELDKNVNV